MAFAAKFEDVSDESVVGEEAGRELGPVYGWVTASLPDVLSGEPFVREAKSGLVFDRLAGVAGKEGG